MKNFFLTLLLISLVVLFRPGVSTACGSDYAEATAIIPPISSADQFEPDDTAEQAAPITIGALEAQVHNFHQAGDYDWVSFFSDGEVYQIATGNLGANCDTVLELYDANFNLVAFDDDSGYGDGASLINTYLDAGDYFLLVRHYDPQALGEGTEYELRIDYQLMCETVGLKGHVTDAETGLPITGAQVRVTINGISTSYVTTDTNGFYLIDLMFSGSYSLTVRRSCYNDFTTTGPAFVGYQTIDVALTPRAGTGMLTGTVYSDGRPLADANLTIDAIPLKSASDGTYSIRLLQGTSHHLMATAPRHEDFSVTDLVVTAGQTNTFDFQMTQSDTDGDGMPDIHESRYSCLLPDSPDGEVDFDGDGLSSLAEYFHSRDLDPCAADTDSDGMTDGDETSHSCLLPLTADGDADPDSDGVINRDELSAQTDPCPPPPPLPTTVSCSFSPAGRGAGIEVGFLVPLLLVAGLIVARKRRGQKARD